MFIGKDEAGRLRVLIYKVLPLALTVVRERGESDKDVSRQATISLHGVNNRPNGGFITARRKRGFTGNLSRARLSDKTTGRTARNLRRIDSLGTTNINFASVS